MFGIGDTELLLILVFAFLLFGPDKLPAMGRTLGKGLRQFRTAQDSVTKVVQNEVLDPMKEAANEGSRAAKAKAGVEEDADLDIETVQQTRTETFAERKARLAAEKAAAATVEAPDEPEPEPEEDRRSVASLYGLAPKKAAATPAAPVSDDDADIDAGASDADAPANAGEEDGQSARA